MPAVSVLMGICNCKETLKAAVDCILAQTFEDWELVLCDDGSTDGSAEEARRLAEGDARIVFLANGRNLGLPKTLDRCAREAKGAYFARMDGDDLCDPTRLQKEYDVISRGNWAVVSCGMLLFDDGGVYGERIWPERPLRADFARSSPFCHAGAMFTREAFEAVGGYSESPDRLRVEDYDLWFRMYRAGYVGYNIPEPLYSMRDDRAAAARKQMKYRVNEYRLRREIAAEFSLGPRAKLMAFKPLILGLLPGGIYRVLHRARHSR